VLVVSTISLVNNPCWKMKPFLACPYFPLNTTFPSNFYQLDPTRWKGSRCIDYFITSCPDIFRDSDIALSEEAIADRKKQLLITRFLTSVILFHTARSHEHPFRFQKTPDLAKPEETPIDQWFQFCHEFLTANPAPSLPCSSDQLLYALSLYYHI
jgi:hypothetical protein